MRATMFNDAVDRFHPIIEKDKVSDEIMKSDSLFTSSTASGIHDF